MAGRKTIWDLALEVSGKDKGAKQALRTIKRQIEDVQKAGKQLGADFKNFTANATKLALGVAGGVAAATAGVVAMANSFAETGDKVAKTSARLGIGIEAYQGLGYAMQQSGLSAEDFDSALEKFNLTVRQGAAGNEAAAKQLKDVGLSAAKLAGLKPEQAMERLSDYMKTLPSDAERTRVAVTLFGKAAGPKMMAAMKQGSSGLQDLMKEAKSLGIVLTEEQARQSESYIDAQTRLKKSVTGMKNQFIGGAIGPLTEAFDHLKGAIVDQLPAIQEIGKKFGEWLGKLVKHLPDVIAKIKEFGSWVKNTVLGVKDFVGGWKNLGKIIAGIAIAPTLISGFKTVFSLGKLIRISMGVIPGIMAKMSLAAAPITGALLPIIGIVAGIALAVYTVVKNFDKLKAYAMECFERIKAAFGTGKDGASNFTEVLGTVKKALGVILGILEGGMLFAIKTIMNLITSAIQIVIGAFKVLWNVIKLILWPIETVIKVISALFTEGWGGALRVLGDQFKKLGTIFSGIFDGIKIIIGGIADFWKGQFKNAIEFVNKILGNFGLSIEGILGGIKSFFSAIGNFFIGIGEGIKNIFSGIGNFFTSVWDGVKNIAGKAWDGIKGVASSAWDGMKGFASQYVENARQNWAMTKDIAGKAWDGIKNVASGAWDGIKNGVSKLKENATENFNKLKDVANVGFNKILDVASWGLDKISDKFPGVADAGQKAIGAIRQAASGDFSGLKELGLNAIGKLQEGFSKFKDIAGEKINALAERFPILGKVIEFIKGVIGGLKNAFRFIFDTIKSIVGAFVTFFKDVFNNPVAAVKNLIGSLADIFSGVFNVIKGKIESFAGIFTGLWEGIKNITFSVWEGIKSYFANAVEGIKTVWNGIKGFFTGLWDAIKQGPAAAVQYIKDAFFGLFNNIQDKLFGFINKIKEGWDAVKGFFGGVGEKIGGIFGGDKKANTVPGHAEGGIFKRRHIAEIAERGAEAVVPLNKTAQGFDIWKQAGELGGYLKRASEQAPAVSAASAVAPVISAVAPSINTASSEKKPEPSPVMEAAAQKISHGDTSVKVEIKMTNNFSGGAPDEETIAKISEAGQKIGNDIEEKIRSVIQEMTRDQRRLSFA